MSKSPPQGHLCLSNPSPPPSRHPLAVWHHAVVRHICQIPHPLGTHLLSNSHLSGRDGLSNPGQFILKKGTLRINLRITLRCIKYKPFVKGKECYMYCESKVLDSHSGNIVYFPALIISKILSVPFPNKTCISVYTEKEKTQLTV